MTVIDRSFKVGKGRTGFLLIHGLGGTPVELKFVAKGLARRGFLVHCCQLAGHCGSEADLIATTWQDWYASVVAAFEELRAACDAVVVGGLSMGGVLALHLAAQRPREVDGLVLYAPTLWYDGWSTPWYRFVLQFALLSSFGQAIVRRVYRYTEGEPYGIKDPAIRGVVLAAMKSGDTTQAGILTTPGDSVCQLYNLVRVVQRELRSITAPALVVQARDDDLSSLKNAEYLQRNLGGLVGTLVLEDSYHIVTVDRQRDLLIEGTMAFATVLEARLQSEALSGETVLPLTAAQSAKARPTSPAAVVPDAPPTDAARGPRLP
jgi:carboxylesterase